MKNQVGSPTASGLRGSDDRQNGTVGPADVLMPSSPGAYGPEPVRAGSELTLSVGHTRSEWWQDATLLAARTVSAAAFVPFHHHTPTYRSMTDLQQKYYFYWRSRVRKQVYPRCSWGYLLLYLYELMHGVGVASADAGLSQMQAIWQAYRMSYTRLDHYLSTWLLDYAAVYGCRIKAPEIAARLWESGVPMTGGHPNALFEAFADRSIRDLPLELLVTLSRYDWRLSSFYLAGHGAEVEEAIREALYVAEQWMLENSGQYFFEWFRPETRFTLLRRPFAGAPYDGSVEPVVVVDVYDYTAHAPLRDFCTWLIKFKEQQLRSACRFHGKMSVGSPFHLELGKAVGFDAEADKPKMSSKIARRTQYRPELPAAIHDYTSLDPEMLRRLQEEADEVLVMLTEHLPPVTVEAPVPRSMTATHGSGGPAVADGTLTSEARHSLSEAEALPVVHARLLRALATRQSGALLRDILLPGAKSLELVIDEINEWALEHLGDLVIDPGPPAEIYEYSRDSLRVWLENTEGIECERG